MSCSAYLYHRISMEYEKGNKMHKTLLAFFSTLTITTIISSTTALAWDRRYYEPAPPPPVPNRSEQFGVNLGAGMLGLAAGVIVGQAIAPSRQIEIREYDNPYRHHHDHWNNYRPAPNYAGYDEGRRFQPWTHNWYRWCSNNYANFDPETGTYQDYNGINRFCEVRR